MINVYTDGSYIQETGMGAWAYWIETPDNTYKSWGTIKNCSDALYVELYAIYMASFAVCILPEQPTVIYWCDSLSAVHMLYRPQRKYGYTDKTDIRDQILEIVHFCSCTGYCFNYIPRNSTPEHKWCDKKVGKLTNRNN